MFLSEKKSVNSQKCNGLFHLHIVDYLTADLFIWTYIYFIHVFVGYSYGQNFRYSLKSFLQNNKKKGTRIHLMYFEISLKVKGGRRFCH